MSDPKADELPDLPDLPDLEELPELPDLPDDVPPMPEESAGVEPPHTPPPATTPPPVPAGTPSEPAPAPPVEAPLEEIAATPAATEAGGEPEEKPVEKPVEPSTPDAAPAAPATPGLNELAEGEKPPLRILDKAPFFLRKAAILCVAGSLLPWMPWLAKWKAILADPEATPVDADAQIGGWFTAIVAKAVILVGLWLWYRQVQHNWGPKLTGILGKLASLDLKPKPKPKKEDARTKARRAKTAQPQQLAALEHPFPTGLHVLSLAVILLGAFVVPRFDGMPGKALGIAIAELGMLAWSAGTYVHIYAYERWGRFSPIFPLMFLAMVFAGLLSIVSGFGQFGSSPLIGTGMVLGGGIVAAGGGLAAYTIVEALMQAKREGDEKKKAAADARKAQREARKTAGGTTTPPASKGDS